MKPLSTASIDFTFLVTVSQYHTIRFELIAYLLLSSAHYSADDDMMMIFIMMMIYIISCHVLKRTSNFNLPYVSLKQLYTGNISHLFGKGYKG